jgi:hypothetical protein
MADHLRKQIRDAIVARLGGLPSTGSNVFTAPVYPLEDSQLPALIVSIVSETTGWAEPTEPAPRIIGRSCFARITAVAKATAALYDTLDQIALEVEVALSMPAFTPSGSKFIDYVSIDIEQVAAEQPTGRAEMLFNVRYLAAENAPDIAL